MAEATLHASLGFSQKPHRVPQLPPLSTTASGWRAMNHQLTEVQTNLKASGHVAKLRRDLSV